MAALVLLAAAPARADAILALQNVNGSPYVDLSSILNGTYQIANIIGGAPASGSINVTNDVAGGITSLTIYFDGVTGPANDAGSTLTCHNFNFGSITDTCSVFDPNNSTAYANGAKTPANLPMGSYPFTWDFSAPMTGNFNIAWSSFSGSGYTGCLSGSASCAAPVPETSSLTLFSTGMLVAAGLLYWRRKSHPILD